MSQLRENLVERLKKAYSAYYDIEEIQDGSPLKALCSYHLRDSQYVLMKQAELWAAESHEYLYLWSTDHLDVPLVEEVFRRVTEDGEPGSVPTPSTCTPISPPWCCMTAPTPWLWPS